MKVIAVMVMSVDGKTTKGDSPNLPAWTSPEDQTYFAATIQKNHAIIMGRKTFETIRKIVQLSADRLRIVMTQNPDAYADLAVQNQLEFSSDDPQTILDTLTKRGYDQVLLVGGAHVNAAFFKENLVTELWLTLEPKLLGTGNPLIADSDLDLGLALKSFEELNDSGTLLLKYHVMTV